jgi:hypothetical protein
VESTLVNMIEVYMSGVNKIEVYMIEVYMNEVDMRGVKTG